MRSNSAFTLIELLIVVAIIAILAAIAVPNMLQAQVRAKVSHTKSNLRVLSVALELYQLDNNHYPPDSGFGVRAFLHRLLPLSTPVSFLTAIPSDPFALRGPILSHAALNGNQNPYSASVIDPNAFIYPLTFDYAARKLPDGQYESDALWSNISAQPTSVEWAIRGIGPDLWPSWLGEGEAAYDVTNGTKSTGNIYWTGPGRGEDFPENP